MENQNIVYLVRVGLKLQYISVVHAVITCLGVVVHRGIGGEILKMRCKTCPICSKHFVTRMSLRRHLRRHKLKRLVWHIAG